MKFIDTDRFMAEFQANLMSNLTENITRFREPLKVFPHELIDMISRKVSFLYVYVDYPTILDELSAIQN